MKQRRNENKGWDVACLLDRYDANVLNRMRELIKKCTAKCNKHGLGVGGGEESWLLDGLGCVVCVVLDG